MIWVMSLGYCENVVLKNINVYHLMMDLCCYIKLVGSTDGYRLKFGQSMQFRGIFT